MKLRKISERKLYEKLFIVFLISSALAFAFLTLWMSDNQASILTNILCLAVLVPSTLIMFGTGYRLIKYLSLNLKKIKVRISGTEINTAVINGSLKAVSGVFDSVSLKDGTATNFTVNTFKALGVSDFAGDALFHGNVSIDGALSVLGIASAKDIREGGVLLKDKYLGIDAKSKDADKLDGLDSTAFAQLDKANSFTGINSFTQVLNANGGVAVDGKTVVSADGSTLYENGAALSSKYLGINAKAVSAGTADNATNAANADKLDGLDSTAFAQLAKDNTYTGKNTFTQAIYADGGLIVDGKTVVSADGSTLYENGIALSTKYLGINSTAADSKNLAVLMLAILLGKMWLKHLMDARLSIMAFT